MIELYPKGQTDFSLNGIALHPSEATVTYQENGQYDLEMTLPVTDDLPEIDWGMVIRCTVPRQQIDEIHLGTVSYWTVTAAEGAKLYANVPTEKRVSYSPWVYSQIDFKPYEVGDKVTYNRHNYQCIAYDASSPMVQVPPESNSSWWQRISDTTGKAGKLITTLEAWTVIMKTGDFNGAWMEVATLTGCQGYIKIEECTATGESDERTIPGWTITEQSFTVTDIRKDERNGKTLMVTCEHVSYQLGRTMLGECNLADVTPATAVMFIAGAMKEPYPGEIQTNLTDLAITADFSWKNAQAAVLDPKNGVLQATGGVLIRDDFNVYLLAEGDAVPRYSIRYGINMQSVRWTGNAGNIVTRVYPTAQAEDGSTLLLPEEHIDTVRTVPFVKPEVLNTGLKIGQEIEDTDGTKITLDEDAVYQRMRTAAQNRFTIDKADMAQVKLELDWIHMPDTEEYAQYRSLVNAAPGDWVEVISGPLNIRTTIRMTGYTWDPILLRYKGTTFGDQKVQSSIAGYQLGNGSVTARALGAGSVGSSALMADSVTAREIAAYSITADRIASRQITAELIAAQTITAYEIAAQAITTDKLAANSVTANQIAAGAITAAAIAASAITAEAIAAGAVTADKVAAGAIDATKIAALAITTEKLAADAVTAGKIAAGAITSDKISTADLSAIQATLQIADIASATIASADIDYAQVKDLNAQSAYFGQAVIQAGLANKLYVPRLSVGYAQMIGATVGDLVVQASNGNFYAIDVDLAGNVTATQRNVSQSEIESGHTTDGRQLVMDTDILAENLNTNNLTASHALMYSITANIIDVDQLWAREAFVNKLMVQDISSNTYIQSTIGNWQSQSTITQTVNSLSSRIDQMGYGTIFYSETEPSHDNLVAGDIWIEPVADNTWDDIAEYTWDELSSWTWEQVAGKYRMYVWTGDKFKILYDNLIISELQTEINQNAYAITLKANQTQVDTLAGDVTQFAATLEVQAEQISAAVSSVNSKGSNYVRLTDPADDPAISLNAGDTWTKAAGNGTWDSVGEYTWNQLADLTWDELAGSKTYTWTGTEWILSADAGATVVNRALIEESDKQITLLVEESERLGDRISTNSAQITIQADRITQEVQRATNAEDGKISKTTQYQTADAIVSEAVSQSASSASGIYLAKTTQYQTADAIVTEAVRQSSASAAGTYISKTTTYQTADSIVTEAVRQSGVNVAQGYLAKTTAYQTVNDIIADSQAKADAAATSAKNASIAKTSTYQSAQSIVNSAVAQAATAAGQTYIAKTTSYQTADAIVMAAETYTDGHAYSKVSGITITSGGIDISGSQYVQIASGGYFKVQTGNFGIDTNSSTYVLWSGASTAANSNFRLKKDGSLTVTKLMVLGENGQETEFNLRNGNLWKLNYQTVKQNTITTDSDGYCTGFTLSNGTTVNFRRAASVTLSGAWVGSTYTVTASNGRSISESFGHDSVASELSGATETITSFSSGHKATAYVTASSIGGGNGRLFTFVIDATSEYNSGVTSGRNGVTLSAAGWIGGSNVVSASNGKSVTVNLPAISLTGGTSFTSHKTTVYASGGGSPGAVASLVVDATDEYNTGVNDGYAAGWIDGYNAAAAKVGVSGGAGYNNGSFSFPVATSAAGSAPTGSWTIRADVSNPAQGYFTGEAQVDGVVRAQRTRQFSQ